MSAATSVLWASERSSNAGGAAAPSTIPFSIVPRDDGWAEGDAPALDLSASPEEDPTAEVIQRRTAEPTTLLLISVMVCLIAAGLAGEVLWPRQPLWRPAVAVQLPKETLQTRPSPLLFKLAHEQVEGAWREAMLELGRRGALRELASLRSHAALEIRALVPLAFLEMGAAAHEQIPWLAEGLTSPDEPVRNATMTVLRTLVRRHGVFQMPAADESYRDLAQAAP